MKRLCIELSPLSDEIESVSKRARFLANSPTSSVEINENEEEIISNEPIISLDSQNVHDDDIIEVIHRNIDCTCQQNDNTFIIISDSDSDDNDDDQGIDVTTDISPSLISTSNTSISSSPLYEDIEIVEQDNETSTENHHELIDLTDDEPNSIYCLSNKLERKSSIDDEQCPICLETFSDLQHTDNYLIMTRCRHIMCTLCSRKLLTQSSRCPICRENISSTTNMSYCILT